MLEISLCTVNTILKDYNILFKAVSYTELQRYDYEEDNPESKEVRLIVKAVLQDGSSVVVRLKNESDVSVELVEKQSQFAALLKNYGIDTPTLYKTGQNFAKWYLIHGYHVIVTVEEFVDGELAWIDAGLAEKSGRLLAKIHNIAEAAQFHIEYGVLFDPFTENDLFAHADFLSYAEKFLAVDQILYENIVEIYNNYMEVLSPLKNEPRYVVQGDFSDCNLYQTQKGCLGVFDFNRCGDNNLYCDAVMQAVFQARLMNYPEGCKWRENPEGVILPAFLKGYNKERPFSETQRYMYPYLYAVIDAFWSMDIKWSENSLIKKLEGGDTEAVRDKLETIRQKLLCLKPMPTL